MKTRKNIKRSRRRTLKGGGIKEIINGAEKQIQNFFSSVSSGFTFIFDGATPGDVKNSVSQSVKKAKKKLDKAITQNGGKKKTNKKKRKK